MAANDAIEVALRPVPSANVLVPYQITIPTMAGYGHHRLQARRDHLAGQAADRAAALTGSDLS